jgi:hypothetical protein
MVAILGISALYHDSAYEFSRSLEIADFSTIVQELARIPIYSTLTV